MRGFAFDYLTKALTAPIAGGSPYTWPGTFYVAFCSKIPQPSDTAATITEFTASDYARVAVAASALNWNNVAPGRYANANQITFASPVSNWGTAIAVVIFDALTKGTGNPLFGGILRRPFPINNGDSAPVIDIEGIIFGFGRAG